MVSFRPRGGFAILLGKHEYLLLFINWVGCYLGQEPTLADANWHVGDFVSCAVVVREHRRAFV